METVTDEIVSRADQILKQSFPNAVIEWDPMTTDGRATGWVIWDGFAGTDPVDRQLAVSKVLRSAFAPDGWKLFAAVFAVTPEELAMMDS